MQKKNPATLISINDKVWNKISVLFCRENPVTNMNKIIISSTLKKINPIIRKKECSQE